MFKHEISFKLGCLSSLFVLKAGLGKAMERGINLKVDACVKEGGKACGTRACRYMKCVNMCVK